MSHVSLSQPCASTLCFMSFLLGGCETGEELSRSYPGQNLDVTGNWRSVCFLADDDNSSGYTVESYQIKADSSYQMQREYFSEADCDGAAEQTFLYRGELREGAKVVANDGALAVYVTDIARNQSWPESIASLSTQRIIRIQDDQFYWGEYAQQRNSVIDYSVVYTKQP